MAKPLTICNTTPVINFAEIGRLDVLRELFGDMVIPPAVCKELKGKPVLFPQAARAVSGEGFTLMVPADRLLVEAMTGLIHRGEAECLALAMEHHGSLVLLDDLAAREISSARGIRFTGTLGCLMEAKRQGLIPVVKPLLDDLRSKARFWVSDSLVRRILQQTGEL